jgi:hypothetical protein
MKKIAKIGGKILSGELQKCCDWKEWRENGEWRMGTL